jgi:hypothetical protein
MDVMLYDEQLFSGETKRHGLGAFSGKIESMKKQMSGNLIVTLSREKNKEIVTKDCIFKKLEIEAYGLEETLQEGKAIMVYGIITPKKTIFPVLIVKYKTKGEKITIEVAENEAQYQLLLAQVDTGHQSKLM